MLFIFPNLSHVRREVVVQYPNSFPNNISLTVSAAFLLNDQALDLRSFGPPPLVFFNFHRIFIGDTNAAAAIIVNNNTTIYRPNLIPRM